MKNLVILILFIVSVLLAAPVNIDKAEKVASNWFVHKYENRSIVDYENIGTESEKIFVFKFEDGGFVILSGDDTVNPVLGYSENSVFVNDSKLYNFNGWKNHYIEEQRYLSSNTDQANLNWERILENDFSFEKKDRNVGPLVETKWDQNPLYNNYCPVIDGQLAVVGCVATAMAQVLKYYNYPMHGTGNKTYYDNWGCNQTLSADFGNATYDWDNMPIKVTSASSPQEIHEVAQISYHCGVAVSMMYGTGSTGGSGAYSWDVPDALIDYFRIDESAVFREKDSYSNEQWKNMVRGELDQSRPMYYSGYGDVGGHAFVCDGYQGDDYFHFNWGWSGANDGYFALTNLNPGSGGAGGGGYSFNYGQGAVFNSIPKPVDIVFDQDFDDLLIDQESLTLDLNEYFSSSNGNTITFDMVDIDNEDVVEYAINGNMLTISKVNEGVAELRLNMETLNDDNFIVFNVISREYKPLAGTGFMYNFNGNTIYYNDLANTTVNSLSVFALIKPNGFANGGIFANGSSSMGLYLTLTPSGVVKFNIKTDDGTIRKVYSEASLEEDVWSAITGVFDGQNVKIYINGKLDAEQVFTTSSSYSFNSNSSTIGNCFGTFFDGSMDNFYLTESVLTETDIKNLLKNKNIENGLVKLSFDQGFGNDITNEISGESLTVSNGASINYTVSTAPLMYVMNSTSITDEVIGNGEFTLVQQPQNGSVDLSSSGDFTYNSGASFSNEDSFSYKEMINSVYSNEYKVELFYYPVDIDEDITVKGFEINSIYPNPFNPTTTINYSVKNDSELKLVVYNVSGSKVAELYNGNIKAGNHSINFDASNLSSGVYYLNMISGLDIKSSKIVLLK